MSNKPCYYFHSQVHVDLNDMSEYALLIDGPAGRRPARMKVFFWNKSHEVYLI